MPTVRMSHILAIFIKHNRVVDELQWRNHPANNAKQACLMHSRI